MSRLIVVVLAIIGLCSASPASEEACKNFLKGSKFDSSALDGTWTVVYFWPFNTVAKKSVFQYRALSAEQVTEYENEMSSSSPGISWEKVKYSANIADDTTNKEAVFLLEIEGDTGYVKAIPAGDLFKQLKNSGRLIAVNYAYKHVGEYLAVKWCDDSAEGGFLMKKGTEHDAADVERVASGIESTMSSSWAEWRPSYSRR